MNSATNELPKQTSTIQWQEDTTHSESPSNGLSSHNLEIITTAFGNGSTHDFRLFKENYAGMANDILHFVDPSYLGIKKHHTNSQISAKKSKFYPLTPDWKAAYRKLASQRIFYELYIG